MAATVVVWIIAATAPPPLAASNGLGTAGLYRFIPVANCGQPILAQMEGACDPPPVDAALSLADKIQAHLDRAQRLVLLLRMPQARAAADQALELDSGNFSALKFRTRLALNMWDGDTAWRDVNAALKIAPKDSDLLATKAQLRWRREEKYLALQDVTAALKANLFNTDALCMRGWMLMQMGQLKPAIADLNKAVWLEPDFKLALLFRAQTNLRMQNFEASIRDASNILGQNSNDPSALEVRAFAQGAIGRLAEAADDLSSILGQPGDGMRSPAENPHHRRLLLQRMVLFVKLDRKVEAQQDVDMLLSSGGKPGVLQLQLFLRQNGFPEVQVDGQRNARLEESLRSCLIQQACQQALEQRI